MQQLFQSHEPKSKLEFLCPSHLSRPSDSKKNSKKSSDGIRMQPATWFGGGEERGPELGQRDRAGRGQVLRVQEHTPTNVAMLHGR
jgi:hypothetical protein